MDLESPILIGSCPSSGSTLLSVILDSHSKLLCGNELSIFCHPFVWMLSGREWRSRILTALDTDIKMTDNWDLKHGCVPRTHILDVNELGWYGFDIDGFKKLVMDSNSGRELADRFFSHALKMKNKLRWIEKTPSNIYSMNYFLIAYPKGKGIVIIRDGRDVVCSLKRRGFSLGEAISIWLIETTMCVELSKNPRVHLVRYEDLVLSTLDTLSGITNFLGVEMEKERFENYTKYTSRDLNDPREFIHTWKNKPVDGIKTISINQWKHDLSEEELAVFNLYRIRKNKAQFLPGKPLPDLTTIQLLKENGYDIPKEIIFSWRQIFSHLSSENNHVTMQLRNWDVRRNTYLSMCSYDHPRHFYKKFQLFVLVLYVSILNYVKKLMLFITQVKFRV